MLGAGPLQTWLGPVFRPTEGRKHPPPQHRVPHSPPVLSSLQDVVSKRLELRSQITTRVQRDTWGGSSSNLVGVHGPVCAQRSSAHRVTLGRKRGAPGEGWAGNLGLGRSSGPPRAGNPVSP